ncbi:MAG: PQQ-binding-like beta-propeller repeat protein [Ignavibacterium sp.]|nr:PQQ-binding-like beta-propeller repeat protein [Ignavibacterium sp.]
MRQPLYLIILISIIFFYGCAKSLIKISFDKDENQHLMFGGSSGRNFYNPVEVSDSLIEVWNQDVYGGFNNSSVVVKDSLIFTSDLGGRIFCFDVYSGRQIGVLRSKGSVFSAPLIRNYNLVYALVIDNENKTELIIYDLFRGLELFNIEIKGRVLSEMILENDNIILCTERGEVQKITIAAKEIWSTKTNSKNYSNPALADNKILLSDINGNFIALDYQTGKIIYKNKIAGPVFSGITTKDDKAFFADNNGVVYCVDILSGKLIWNYDTGDRIISNPALDDNNLYIGNLRGNLYSINQNNGSLNWVTKLDGLIQSTPLITSSKIIAVNLNRSFSILNKLDGSIRKTIELNGRGKLSPVLYDNILIIGYDDGKLSAYEFIY